MWLSASWASFSVFGISLPVAEASSIEVEAVKYGEAGVPGNALDPGCMFGATGPPRSGVVDPSDDGRENAPGETVKASDGTSGW